MDVYVIKNADGHFYTGDLTPTGNMKFSVDKDDAIELSLDEAKLEIEGHESEGKITPFHFFK